MRKRFEQQYVLGRLLIEDTRIPTSKRNGALPPLFAALKKIFITPAFNENVFNILEKKIYPAHNNTGRPGMDLWQIFVLSQVRLCANISYDQLHYMANNDRLIRQLLGIETALSFGANSALEEEEITYQNIKDNLNLLDDSSVKELNELIVLFGHTTFKKKEEEALCLKTDSFVVESEVHFPTDYGLLWDSARKCLDLIVLLEKTESLPGWRKARHWYRALKNKMRALGKACSSGGKQKTERVTQAVETYLLKAKALLAKLNKSTDDLTQNASEGKGHAAVADLLMFMKLLEKHIDLLERRLLKGEHIPHEEKMFSVFEQYTEWICKGKKHPSVELGKKVALTTDHYDLIVDYHLMENESDAHMIPALVKRITPSYTIASWSFDKGFWHKDNKELLSRHVETLVMPKKGKCTKAEAEEQGKPLFKKGRKRHSAIESNINELEHRGLDRCPDKGYPHFKRYIGLAICAYNLKKIGMKILEQRRKEEAELKKRQAA
jgi:hypothetical protein